MSWQFLLKKIKEMVKWFCQVKFIPWSTNFVLYIHLSNSQVFIGNLNSTNNLFFNYSMGQKRSLTSTATKFIKLRKYLLAWWMSISCQTNSIFHVCILNHRNYSKWVRVFICTHTFKWLRKIYANMTLIGSRGFFLIFWIRVEWGYAIME